MKNYKDLFYGSILLLSFLSMVTFSSCSNYLTIVTANKTKHISGIQNGKNYVDFSIEINSKVDFSFKSLELNDSKIIESLYIKDLSTGLSSTKINSDVKKGIYQFGFRIYNTDSFNKDETVTFKYSINNKDFQLKKKIDKEAKIQPNR